MIRPIGRSGIEARIQQISAKMAEKLGDDEPAFTLPSAPQYQGGTPSAMAGQIGTGGSASNRPMDPFGNVVNIAGDEKNQLRSLIQKVAAEQGLEPGLLEAVVGTESDFNPNLTSNKGAQGLMQLMPETARTLGVTNPFDPEQNLRGGAKYLSQMMKQFPDLNHALAAYNAGPGAVRRYNGVPPFRETQDYVKRVTSRIQGLQGRIGSLPRVAG